MLRARIFHTMPRARVFRLEPEHILGPSHRVFLEVEPDDGFPQLHWFTERGKGALQALVRLAGVAAQMTIRHKKRKDYTFRRQFHYKPGNIPGCPQRQTQASLKT